jgi:tetratricopeptide (TPR) repeat protein
VNNKYKYKAYISYSHCDERWAKWLHRSLESYRVPRKLVGTKTAVGKVPARIKPVFRDRDDLSSAGNLGDTVKQALVDSENMIVVCSPDAAASFWVNEEIRQFASLGRDKKIFCVIVDGDPTGTGTDSACFPDVLAEIGLQEPLAADIRKWADGKRLSALKLVAGMLGLPLDQLRRRDLQKRQKMWALTSVAAITLAAVLVSAITSWVSVQQRRESGESLVAYKLNELRTMLNVKEDPENLGRLNQWAQQDLDRLVSSAGEGEDALTGSAMALREEGIAFWQNGALTEAMEKFQQSWVLFAEAYRHDRSNHMVFFELGQAEYWIGQTHMDQGNLVATEKAFMSYAEITRRLILLQPENAEWVLEMAYALTGLGRLQSSLDANNPDRTLQFMQSSLEYNQIALVLDPTNDYYRSELGQSQAFLADAQLAVCDLEGALKSRQEHVVLESELLEGDPDNVNRVKFMVYALTGYSTVKEYQGDMDDAMASMERALHLLEENSLRNVDKRESTINILRRQHRLLRMKALIGETEEAWEISKSMLEKWQELELIGEEDMRTALIYVDFLISRAWLAKTNGDEQMAHQLLNDIQLHLAASQRNMSFKRTAGNMLVQAAFLQWEMSGELPSASILAQLPEYIGGSGRTRACLDANRAANKAVMLGQQTQAREFTEYLLSSGYRETGFMNMCKRYSLCPGQ